MNTMRSPRFAIAVVVLAEMFGTSLWFSVNAVADALHQTRGMDAADLGHLTSAVQFGFICGTFLFAISGLADRYSASRVFAVCAVLGALFNGAFAAWHGGMSAALAFRFLTGVMLAGIYPVGMKLVVSWVPDRAGQMLGWLVGMLVLGSGLPHFVRGLAITPDWRTVIYSASALALLAAAGIAWLGDGPFHGQRRQLRWGGVLHAFRVPRFRAAALGYFGHMWELYAFWAMVPLLIGRSCFGLDADATYLATAAVFLAGGAGCVLGGLASRHVGSARVAILALAGSASLCAVYPWLHDLPAALIIGAVTLWGLFVVADSPQFSALAAGACAKEDVGGALALMNSIGFSISIVSIELVTQAWPAARDQIAWLLLPGPLFGLWAMRRLWHRGQSTHAPGVG